MSKTILSFVHSEKTPVKCPALQSQTNGLFGCQYSILSELQPGKRPSTKLLLVPNSTILIFLSWDLLFTKFKQYWNVSRRVLGIFPKYFI